MMLRPKDSAAIPVLLEGEVKPLAKAISNTSASHLNVVQTLPSCEELERAHMIAGLERELNIPESIPAQDLNPELASWLAAYPRRDKPLKNNHCEYDPEIDYSKVYAFATKHSHAAKRRDHISRIMPATWEATNPVKGWHGERCPTVMDLLNYAEKSANWELERYEFWQDKNCMLSPKRPPADPTVAANEDIHEHDGRGFNDKLWDVNENLRYQSWLMWRGDEHASRYPLSPLERFFEHVPYDIPEQALLQIKLGEIQEYPPNPLEVLSRNGMSVRRAFKPIPEPYVYRHPLKMYLHAVKRYHEHGEGSGERLVKLYHLLGIQPQFFVPIAPKLEKHPSDKKDAVVKGEGFVMVGPPQETIVEKVAKKIEALPAPKQEYIPSDEAIDELSEGLSHGMYFAQSVARVIAEHVSKKTVQDMLPAIEFSLREMVKKELQAILNPSNIPTALHSMGFSTENTKILTGQGFTTVRRSDMYDEVNKAAALKLC